MKSLTPLLKRGLLLGLLSYAGIGLITPANADNYENNFQYWEMVTFRAPVSPNHKLQIYMEGQPRGGKDFQMVIVRPALGYQVTPKLSLWQGYAWAPIFQPTFRNENRIFQQALSETKFKKLDITNRTRLEERWFSTTNGTAVRARHQLRLSYPITRSGKWAIATSDELFINLNSLDNGPVGGFEQNRAFIGLTRKVHENATMELGYMNQLLNRHSARNALNHAILLGLYVRIR
jgi:hypothetical protein